MVQLVDIYGNTSSDPGDALKKYKKSLAADIASSKPPETWLERRRRYMAGAYKNMPFGGFSGVLVGAATQKKKLLGA